MTKLKIIILSGLATLCLTFFQSCNSSQYKGKPFSNSKYKDGAQIIPGKLQCEFYDFGGEGIAYHDSDSTNSGSGALNPANGTYLHEFRINEAVDISYIKKGLDPKIDDNPYNLAEPEKDQLYIGWTEPGEWVKYTINVKTTGTYQMGLMYTSNQNGLISFSVNNVDATGPIKIPNTFVAEDSVAWRQWHHWNYLENMAKINLEKGIQVLTLHTVDIGQMNYEHIDFNLIENN